MGRYIYLNDTIAAGKAATSIIYSVMCHEFEYLIKHRNRKY